MAEAKESVDDPWGGVRAEAIEAFRAGGLKKALTLSQQAVLTDALSWFLEEGIAFAPPTDSANTLEFLGGLALAARNIVEERGEEASFRLLIAANAIGSIASFRLSLEGKIDISPDAIADTFLKFHFLGMDLGRADAIIALANFGVIEAYEQREKDRERRRLGAQKTNDAKATVKERALGVAMQITGTNPTLSNADLAELVRNHMKLPTTIRTLTEWVREWRRHDYFPQPKR